MLRWTGIASGDGTAGADFGGGAHLGRRREVSGSCQVWLPVSKSKTGRKAQAPPVAAPPPAASKAAPVNATRPASRPAAAKENPRAAQAKAPASGPAKRSAGSCWWVRDRAGDAGTAVCAFATAASAWTPLVTAGHKM